MICCAAFGRPSLEESLEGSWQLITGDNSVDHTKVKVYKTFKLGTWQTNHVSTVSGQIVFYEGGTWAAERGSDPLAESPEIREFDQILSELLLHSSSDDASKVNKCNVYKRISIKNGNQLELSGALISGESVRLVYQRIDASEIGVAAEIKESSKRPGIAEFMTKDGRKFSDVQIKSQTPLWITILHSDGVAKIKAEDLPDDIKTSLGGFDQASVEVFLEAEKKKKQSAKESVRKIELSHQDSQKPTGDPSGVTTPILAPAAPVVPEPPMYESGEVKKFIADICLYGKNVKRWTQSPTISLHGGVNAAAVEIFTRAVEEINSALEPTPIRLVLLPMNNEEAQIKFIFCDESDFSRVLRANGLSGTRVGSKHVTYNRSNNDSEFEKAWCIMTFQQGSTSEAAQNALRSLMVALGFSYTSQTVFSIMGYGVAGKPTVFLTETDRKVIPIFYNHLKAGDSRGDVIKVFSIHWK